MPEFVKDIEEIRRRAIRNIEDGAVTEAYALAPDRSIAILNEALATEIVCVLRYLHHYFMATGVHARAVSSEFKQHADQEREHADEIAERIQQLGGKPDFNPGTLVNRSVAHYVEGQSLADMIREDLIAERMVIDVYNQMIQYFGQKDPTTRTLLEHILAEEEQHATDLADLLYVVDPATGEDVGEDPGTRPLEYEVGQRENRRQSQSSAQAGQMRDPDAQEDTDIYVGRVQRGDREPRPIVQTIADREGGTRGKDMRKQRKNQPRSQDLANRQATEQFAGRGSVSPSVNKTPSTGEGEMRPLQSQGRNRPDERSGEPAHEPGTVGRTRRQTEQPDRFDVAENVNAGGMGGSSRAVRITRPSRKNRAA